MRIAVLWTHSSGYFDACLKALAARPNCDVLFSRAMSNKNAPFDENEFGSISDHYIYQETPDANELQRRLMHFDPDVLLVSSWHIISYRKMLRRFSKAVRILGMDNQWLSTPKQWLGVLTAGHYLHPLYDVAYVPGERQAQFARRLGFPQTRIWYGLYACDHESFAAIYRSRRYERERAPPEEFVFTGRLAAEKGIETLAEAYRLYAERTESPWPLTICGTGPLSSLFGSDVHGITVRGFVQPSELPQTFSEMGCLILPSRFEPWGVVIQEAAAAGLSIICTTRCGASVHMVQDGYNGFVVEADNVQELADTMIRYSGLSALDRRRMAENSHSLSYQFTPDRWASTLYERSVEILKEKASSR